ncbi:ABATE domain-containing protein [Streptomyces sp. NPDC001795]|uniref:CGNR zinc finger domain-containing protein n=1 Tax=Streptomyces sp. NPDC001795 TaxID=3154525 RepID=UPI00332654C9
MSVEAIPSDDVPAEELRFNFLSGRLCLAFVATVGERRRGKYERLRRPADLARWYQEAEVLDAPITITSGGLETARALREAIYRPAQRLVSGLAPAAEDEEVINAAAAFPPLVPVLRSGTARLNPPPTGAERAALSTLARDAIDLFTHVDAARIRECAGPECGLLFVDTSRPGRRRWCSSAACGGKDRAAAYRRRKRAQ